MYNDARSFLEQFLPPSQGGGGQKESPEGKAIVKLSPRYSYTHTVNTKQNNIFNCQKKVERPTVRVRHRVRHRYYLF